MEIVKEFQIAISNAELKQMEAESVADHNKNALGELIYKCQKLQGAWMSCIRKKINDYEQTNYSIIG